MKKRFKHPLLLFFFSAINLSAFATTPSHLDEWKKTRLYGQNYQQNDFSAEDCKL